MEQRRQFFSLRILELPIRETFLYKLRLFLGFPVKLQSDTPVEQVSISSLPKNIILFYPFFC